MGKGDFAQKPEILGIVPAKMTSEGVFASSVETAILRRGIGVEGLEERMPKGANPNHDFNQLLLF